MAFSPPKIGLLGGSFNPAHEGHLHISVEAHRQLRLNEIWWLVAPHNPLKEKSELAEYDRRVESARKMARNYPFISVSTLEAELGMQYTAQTLSYLHHRFSRMEFVWLMGADNLAGFHRWHHWRYIIETTPIAVIDRPGYTHRAVRSPVAQALKSWRLAEANAGQLVGSSCPSWVFLHPSRHALSATEIRSQQGKKSW